MTSVEIAASGAAAETLSLPEPECQLTYRAARRAAYRAAISAGAWPLDAARVAEQVVAEMTWGFTAGIFA